VKKAKAAALDTGQIEQGIQKNIFPQRQITECLRLTPKGFTLFHFFVYHKMFSHVKMNQLEEVDL